MMGRVLYFLHAASGGAHPLRFLFPAATAIALVVGVFFLPAHFLPGTVGHHDDTVLKGPVQKAGPVGRSPAGAAQVTGPAGIADIADAAGRSAQGVPSRTGRREAMEINHLSANLDHLLKELQKHCTAYRTHHRVGFYDNPAVNAVGYKSGHIAVYAGLLERIESENELVFILAHELAHYVYGDHDLRLYTGLVRRVLDSAPGLSSGNLDLPREARADEYAVRVLNCYYGHVGGAVRAVEKFSADPGKTKRLENIRTYCKNSGFAEGPLTRLPAHLDPNL